MPDDQVRRHPGPATQRIRLLDANLDLVRYLTGEDRAQLAQISLPAVTVPKGPLSLEELLQQRGAFAALVTDGLVLRNLAIGPHGGMRILGPGEVFGMGGGATSTLVRSSSYRAAVPTRLMLLGNDFLFAACRVPRLFVGVQAGMAEQNERLATQLVICQLPRVADRVLAILWLLAESFGRVTPGGTTVPLSLTHEVLGALVGARRPTVTLALGELADRGALVHQDRGWLLLERPPTPLQEAERVLEEPQLLDQTPSQWAAEPERTWGAPEALAALHETVNQLREQHLRSVEQVRDRLRRVAVSRRRSSAVRRRLRAGVGVSRRPPPSS